MFDDTYKTIATPSEGLYKEKGSKFLAFAYPVHSIDEIKSHLEQLRKDYFDARHHCYAYILGPRKDAFRANDDGGLYDEVRILRSFQTLGSGLPAPAIPPIAPNRLTIIDP